MKYRRAFRPVVVAAVVALVAQMVVLVAPVAAVTPDEAFDRVWNTTDAAVAGGSAGYSWFWGPDVRNQRSEFYQDSPGQQRVVRYYDKSRMEITHPDGDPASIWYVTNGLLTTELVTGRHQTGDTAFELLSASRALVAGDQDNNPGTPSYAEFAPYVTTDSQSNRAGDRTGQAVTQFMSGDGILSTTDARGVTLASYQEPTGHNIASVFWSWAHDPNSGFQPTQQVDWLYVLGYPISEPYWIDATVAGTTRPVLVQLFQRRVLTYDPSNPSAYRVEFGNIGRHYYTWLYESNTLPPVGGQLYSWSLSDWPDETFPNATAFAANGTFHHAVGTSDDPSAILAAFSFLPGLNRADVIASIRVRAVTPEAEFTEACLMIRLEEDLSRDYAFCVNGMGETVALHEDNSGENSEITTLLDYANRPGTNPATQWNELKIYALGNHFWFVINGNVVGDAFHSGGAQSGTVGFYTLNFDTVPVEFEWDALNVWAPE